jgi:hypothetical protein
MGVIVVFIVVVAICALAVLLGADSRNLNDKTRSHLWSV